MASGAGILVGSRYAMALLGWAGTVLVIRQLSEADWGRYSLIFSLLGVIGMVSDLRIGRVVMRAVMDDAEAPAESAGAYVLLRGVIGLVSYALAMAVVVLGNYPDDVVHGTAIAGTVLLITSCASAVELVFEARLWLRDVGVVAVAAQVVQFVGILGLVAVDQVSVVWFTVPPVAAAVVHLLVLSRRARGALRLTVAPTKWWAWLREAAPLALGGALTETYMRIDSVMLSKLDTFTSVGLYTIGYKFADIVATFPGAILTPAFTMLVQAWPDAPERFRATVRQALVLLAVAAAGVGVGFVAFADPVIALLYGERYLPGADAARLLVLSQAVNFGSVLCFTVLAAIGRHRLYPLAAVVGLAANIGLNLVLIPRWSFHGAAVATISTEVLVLAVLAVGASRVPGVRPLPWGALAKVAGAAVLMALVAAATVPILPWPLAMVGTGLAYLAGLHVLRVAGPGGLRALARPGPATPAGEDDDDAGDPSGREAVVGDRPEQRPGPP